MSAHNDKIEAIKIVKSWIKDEYTEDRMEYQYDDIMRTEGCNNNTAMICIAHLANIAWIGEAKWLQNHK